MCDLAKDLRVGKEHTWNVANELCDGRERVSNVTKELRVKRMYV
jgi:hypothetical protein